MLRKEILTFLVILTISLNIATAKKGDEKHCSDFTHCKKCLKESASGCVWHVSADAVGSCIDSEQCNTDEYADGECFEGKDGDKKFNTYTCKDTCETQTVFGCESCLAFDAMGRRKKDNSDCAWYQTLGCERQCVARQRCNEREFRGGRCIKGKKDEDNTEQCSLPITDKCESRNSCDRCLKSEFCSWFVQGDTAKCIYSDRCDHKGFEGGTCTSGATTFDSETTCAAIEERGLDPKPIPVPDDIIREDELDEVRFEKCSDFSGLCTDCLNNGCSFVSMSHECVSSCRDAPADVGCSSLNDLYKPLPIDFGEEAPPVKEPRGGMAKKGTRDLLSFPDMASMMCFDLKLEERNIDLCTTAAAGGCGKCVKTQLFTPPGLVYLWPTKCKWFPKTKTCQPFSNGLVWEGTDRCEDDIDIFPWQPIPPPDTKWPELVGLPYSDAYDFLSGTYGPDLKIVKLRQGSIVTEDYVLTRVRIFVGKGDIVAEVPKIG